MGIFSKETPEDIRTEYNRLEHEIEELSRDIRFLPKPPDPRKILALQKQRADLMKKAQTLKAQIDEHEEKKASLELNELLIANANDILIKVNDKRVRVEENLDVTLNYEGCQHTIKLKIPELLRFYTDPTPNNRALFDLWQRILSGDSITRVIPCRECRSIRLRKLKENHTYKPTYRIGTAKVEFSAIR